MTATRQIDLGRFALESVDRIQFTITKDETAWSGIDSILLTFEKPDRATQFTRSMTVLTDASGIWYYDTLVTDFTGSAAVGYWTINVKVTDGTIVKKYPWEISLYVGDEP